MFDHIMKKTLGVFTLISFFFAIYPLFKPSNTELPSTLMMAFNFVVSVILYACIIYFIKVIRGNEVEVKGSSITSELGVGGYVWRSILIKYLSIIPSIPLLMKVYNGTPSIPYNIFGTTIMIVSSIFITWALFSKDRKGQFNTAISLIRGY